MSVTLTAQDKATLRTAAYGAVALLAYASSKPHKVASRGTLALYSGTGPIGHVLAEHPKEIDLDGNVAELADRILPGLTDAMILLKKKAPAEADNFRSAITIALDTAALVHKDGPTPSMSAMSRKITGALDAA
ncbi:hypothetical protein RB200_42595 [Streptomyces sp. PmtG]